MKAKRILQIVAYDIEDDRKRNRIAKLLEKYGVRVNRSVFECMFTPAQLLKVKENIAGKIDRKTDSVVFYHICVDCFTKTVYLPPKKQKPETVIIG
jgi:CRISPR-associated protein Cas2